MRFKNKKGISPLIATVLIIGFTIVLAALVITWGTKLFKSTVEQTGKTAEYSRICSTSVNIEYTASVSGSDTKIVASNKASQGVEGFLFVAKNSDGTNATAFLAADQTNPQLASVRVGATGTVNPLDGLGPFATKTYTLSSVATPTYSQVEARAIIKAGSDYQVCTNEETVNIA